VPTLGGAPEIIVSPVFDEEGFDSGEETSLRIPETAQHSKECVVSGGVPHPRNLIYIGITTSAAMLSAID
jgi:hypothetical protein